MLGNIDSQNSSWTWWCFAASVFILPLFPALGAVGLFIIGIKIWQRNYRTIFASGLNQSLGILSIMLIISSILAEYPKPSWLGLANFLPFFWLFTALRELIRKPIQLKQLAWILVLTSLPVVILGFGQMYGEWQTSPWLESILGWQLVPQGVPTGRMSSVFIYTNFLAIYLAIAFTLALGLWLDTWQTRSKTNHRKSTQILCLLAIIIVADLGGLVLTSSRNAWGLAVISFMAYAFYLGWRWLVWMMVGSAGTVLWASFVPNWGGTQLRIIVPAFLWERLSDASYTRPVETLRITQWQYCGELISQRPWFGWGLRNFTPLYEAKMNYWFGHPHSLFLMLGAETGIMATLLFMGIVGLILYRGSILLLNWSEKKYRGIFFSYLSAFSGCILFNLSDVTIFDLRVNTIVWILLAALSGIARSPYAKNQSAETGKGLKVKG